MIPSQDNTSGILRQTLAVLPFVNVSGDANLDYLCDGLTESLINNLSQLPQLRVMARSTVFRFRNQQDDPQAAGRELQVNNVVVGRILILSERLLISVEMVDVTDGAQLWGQQYNRAFADLLTIQTEVSQEISDKLRLKLSQEDKQRLARQYTDNNDAYQDYLRGRYFLNKRTEDGLSRAVTFFQQAIEKDPVYALAYTGLADSYSLLGGYTLMPPHEAFPKARAAALKALDIDPLLAEAHASLGFVRLRYDWNWAGAEQAFRQALKINPSYAIAHHWYGTLLMTLGRFDEALAEKSKAQKSDPLSLLYRSGVAGIHYYQRQYEQAVELSRRLLSEAGDYFPAYAPLAVSLIALHRYEEAFPLIEKMRELSGGHTEVQALIGYACAVSGRREEAQSILIELTGMRNTRYVSPYDLALIHTGLGETDEAFACLTRACEERAEGIAALKIDPRIDPLRSDPRYQDLLRRVGFPADEAEQLPVATPAAARWAVIERLYDAALALPIAERAAYLAAACADDEELQQEVQALLDAHAEAGSFLEYPVAAESEMETTARMPTVPGDSLIGQQIGHYRILAKIGAGGMGEVWLAEDVRLRRRVALKILPARFSQDADRVSRFRREALAVSALNHPNILTIFDIDEVDGVHYMATEYVEGHTLRQLLADGKVSLRQFLDIGVQVAAALSEAEAVGVIHRDIKPENVMLRRDGYVKVLDFGLARINEPEGENRASFSQRNLTLPGWVLGTPAYMSPEQALGDPLTSASDIFSFGVVSYELLTGRHPFTAETRLEMLRAITTSDPQPLSQTQSDVPALLGELLQQMLAKEERQRPTAADVRRGLTQIIEQLRHSAARRAVRQEVRRHTVGRSAEKLKLQQLFQAVNASGQGKMCCVTGEPGIGKTTLAEEFLTALRQQGQPLLIAQGHSSERLAGVEIWLPFLRALHSLLREADRESVLELLQSFAPSWHALLTSGTIAQSGNPTGTVAQDGMKQELFAFIQAAAQQQPLLLLLDDLHWADPSSVDLLMYLASHITEVKLLLLLTWRPAEMQQAEHDLLPHITAWQAAGNWTEIPLAFLSPAETDEYLTLEYPDHQFPVELHKLVHARTRGNPLFMTEMVRYLRNERVLEIRRGQWCMTRSVAEVKSALPATIQAVLEYRLNRLERTDRELLAAASVQGEGFDAAVIASVTGMDVLEVEEHLAGLEEIQQLVRMQAEREFPDQSRTMHYQFVHVLYQQVLFESLLSVRQVKLSCAIAQQLMRHYGERDREIAATLARLWETGNDYEQAAAYFLRAAQEAILVAASSEAAELARRGVQLLSRLPESVARDQLELDLQLVLIVAVSGHTKWALPEVTQALNRARTLIQRTGEGSKFFHILIPIWGTKVFRAEYRAADEIAEEILRLAEDAQNQIVTTIAHYMLGLSAWFQGEFVNAIDQLERAIELHRPEDSAVYIAMTNAEPGVFARCLITLPLIILGWPEQAMNRLRDGVSFASESHHPINHVMIYLGQAEMHLYRREWAECQKQAEAFLAIDPGAESDPQMTVVLLIPYGAALAYQGQIERGMTVIRQQLEIWQQSGLELKKSYMLYFLADLSGLNGQPEEGLCLIDEAMSFVNRTGERFMEAELYRVKGELLLKANDQRQISDFSEAEACFLKAIEIAQQQQARLWELRASASLARLWQQMGQREAARQLLAKIYGWFTEGFDTPDLQDAAALLKELND